MNNFIPVYAYAKKKKTSEQNVYRWIRERKIKAEDIKTEERTVTRILINEKAEKN